MIELPNKFNFRHYDPNPDEPDYTAEVWENGIVNVSWIEGDINQSMPYSLNVVKQFIKDGTWKIVD